LWCFSEDSAVPREQWADSRRKVYHKGIPDLKEASDEPRLVVLDDLLYETYSRDACDFFTKGSHYRNIGVIPITKNLFHQGRVVQGCIV